MGRQQKIKQQRKTERATRAVEIERKSRKFSRDAFIVTVLAVMTVTAVLFIKMIKTEPYPKQAILDTGRGDITIEFYRTAAPQTVDNFVKLASENFYDGLYFHRVIADFMIQTGDPQGTGAGGPGYVFEDEINPRAQGLTDLDIIALEGQGYTYDYSLKSKPVAKGSVAMANSGPNTNGSQFFIVTTRAQSHLDGKHTVFAEVVEGLEVAQAIQQGDILKDVILVW